MLLDELAFFCGNLHQEKLYRLLKAQMETALPPFELKVQKTQITFINPKVFACVSKRGKEGLILSFGLPDRVVSERIFQSVEIRPGRWTMHVRISHEDEIDAQLLGWMTAACVFSARKQTPV